MRLAVMILPLAVFVHLQAACAEPTTWSLIKKIAITESGLDTDAVHDNTTGQSYHPPSDEAAAALARGLVAEGHSVDAGIMQINSQNWPRLGLTAETVFDPCRSIAAGSEILGLVSAYNTGSLIRGIRNGYAARVISAGADGTLQPAAGASTPRITGPPSPEPAGGPSYANPFSRPARWPQEMSFPTASGD
jgi:type IV secretion system protein VirB1